MAVLLTCKNNTKKKFNPELPLIEQIQDVKKAEIFIEDDNGKAAMIFLDQIASSLLFDLPNSINIEFTNNTNILSLKLKKQFKTINKKIILYTFAKTVAEYLNTNLKNIDNIVSTIKECQQSIKNA